MRMFVGIGGAPPPGIGTVKICRFSSSLFSCSFSPRGTGTVRDGGRGNKVKMLVGIGGTPPPGTGTVSCLFSSSFSPRGIMGTVKGGCLLVVVVVFLIVVMVGLGGVVVIGFLVVVGVGLLVVVGFLVVLVGFSEVVGFLVEVVVILTVVGNLVRIGPPPPPGTVSCLFCSSLLSLGPGTVMTGGLGPLVRIAVGQGIGPPFPGTVRVCLFSTSGCSSRLGTMSVILGRLVNVGIVRVGFTVSVAVIREVGNVGLGTVRVGNLVVDVLDVGLGPTVSVAVGLVKVKVGILIVR